MNTPRIHIIATVFLTAVSGLMPDAHAEAALPAWDEQVKVTTDSHRADAREQKIFVNAYCATLAKDKCDTFTAGQNTVFNGQIYTEVVYGSFTGKGRQEALLTACRFEASRCTGAALFRKEQGRWKGVQHTEHVTPRDCIKLQRRDGSDMLACRSNTRFLPDLGLSLDLVSPTNRTTYTRALIPAGNLNCQHAGRPITVRRLGDWTRTDVNGDGQRDLQVTVREYQVTFPDEQACQRLQPSAVTGKQSTLSWTAKGSTLSSTPQTATFK